MSLPACLAHGMGHGSAEHRNKANANPKTALVRSSSIDILLHVCVTKRSRRMHHIHYAGQPRRPRIFSHKGRLIPHTDRYQTAESRQSLLELVQIMPAR